MQALAQGMQYWDNRRMAKRYRQKNTSNLVLLGIAAAVVLGLGFLIYSVVRETTGNPILRSQDDVPRIILAEAYAAYQSGEAIFLDTRSAEQFDASHIEGGQSLPLNETESRMSSLDKDKWYITYCT